jgi:hypothetical protein
MSEFKHIYVACKIMARSKTAYERLYRWHEKTYLSDGADPARLKCKSCGFEWWCEALDEWQEATCSNCYGERLMLTGARLEFNNWGIQNGGSKERDDRMRFARTKAKAYGTLLKRPA